MKLKILALICLILLPYQASAEESAKNRTESYLTLQELAMEDGRQISNTIATVKAEQIALSNDLKETLRDYTYWLKNGGSDPKPIIIKLTKLTAGALDNAKLLGTLNDEAKYVLQDYVATVHGVDQAISEQSSTNNPDGTHAQILPMLAEMLTIIDDQVNNLDIKSESSHHTEDENEEGSLHYVCPSCGSDMGSVDSDDRRKFNGEQDSNENEIDEEHIENSDESTPRERDVLIKRIKVDNTVNAFGLTKRDQSHVPENLFPEKAVIVIPASIGLCDWFTSYFSSPQPPEQKNKLEKSDGEGEEDGEFKMLPLLKEEDLLKEKEEKEGKKKPTNPDDDDDVLD